MEILAVGSHINIFHRQQCNKSCGHCGGVSVIRGVRRSVSVPCVPDDFVRWIFPKHLKNRRPKYQAIADKYGYTVDANLVEGIKNEKQFLNIVAESLG